VEMDYFLLLQNKMREKLFMGCIITGHPETLHQHIIQIKPFSLARKLCGIFLKTF